VRVGDLYHKLSLREIVILARLFSVPTSDVAAMKS
jgi:hypothetical protein